MSNEILTPYTPNLFSHSFSALAQDTALVKRVVYGDTIELIYCKGYTKRQERTTETCTDR